MVVSTTRGGEAAGRGICSPTQVYVSDGAVVFRKTRERHGALSNMAAGFPLRVANLPIRTSEALYQALRFPHLPEVQATILEQRSPMAAKMKSRAHKRDSRPDFSRIRVAVMRWCLRVKLAQHRRFVDLLAATGTRPIVESSARDAFWGAIPQPDGTLIGHNVLGCLLVELRDTLPSHAGRLVEPPDLPDLRLLGRPIGIVAPG